MLCKVVLSVSVFQSMVQVETLGELGVFFTLFVVGLEFSPDRIRKVSYLKLELEVISYLFLFIVYTRCFS